MAIGRGRQSDWQDWVTLVLAGLLFVSPWILGFAQPSAASWNAWIGAVVAALLAVLALVRFEEWEEWLNAAIGVWLVLSPWILGFTTIPAAMWTAVVLGALICIVSAWRAFASHGRHGAA